jgi:hypothetical protein
VYGTAFRPSSKIFEAPLVAELRLVSIPTVDDAALKACSLDNINSGRQSPDWGIGNPTETRDQFPRTAVWDFASDGFLISNDFQFSIGHEIITELQFCV